MSQPDSRMYEEQVTVYVANTSQVGRWPRFLETSAMRSWRFDSAEVPRPFRIVRIEAQMP